MHDDQLDDRIDEIEQELLRDDPAFGRQFAQLRPANGRHEAAVLTLLVSSAVFLMIGLAATSVAAWLIGVVSFVASFAVDARHERLVQAVRRPTELAHRHRAVGRRRRDRRRVNGRPRVST